MPYLQKHTTLARFILCIVWAAVLNGMLNTPDMQHAQGKYDYNEKETFAEWFLEDVLDMDGSVNDEDDADTDFQTTKGAIDWAAIPSPDEWPVLVKRNNTLQFPPVFYSRLSQEVPVPPPNRLV